MSPTGFVAILPGKIVTAAQAQRHVSTWLRNCVFEFQREMQEYPAWQPWTSRPPKSGPRQGGRRTGTYGRGWTSSAKFTSDSATVLNRVTYASYVGGPTDKTGRNGGQTAVMRARGWKSASDVSKDVARRTLPKAARVLAV